MIRTLAASIGVLFFMSSRLVRCCKNGEKGPNKNKHDKIGCVLLKTLLPRFRVLHRPCQSVLIKRERNNKVQVKACTKHQLLILFKSLSRHELVLRGFYAYLVKSGYYQTAIGFGWERS